MFLAIILSLPLIGGVPTEIFKDTMDTSNLVHADFYNNTSSIANKSEIIPKNNTLFLNQANISNTTERFSFTNTMDFGVLGENGTALTANTTNATNSNFSGGGNGATRGSSKATGDFNGDGFEDKAIGVPFEGVASPSGTIGSAGAVHVIYGSSGGLSTSSVLQDQLLTQNLLDNGGIPEENDFFGYSLSSGDYNGDGKDDLAIGVPGEGIDLQVATIGNFDANAHSSRLRQGVGVVQVIYGSEAGLSSNVLHNQVKVFIQGFDFLYDAAESLDLFGVSLTSGNFNGDRNPTTGRDIDDLAIGTAIGFSRNGGQLGKSGMVQAIYGSQIVGLDTNQALHDQAFWQGHNNIAGIAEKLDYFGSSLSSADYNGDGYDDLVVGVPGEDIGSIADAGAANVIYGSYTGLTIVGNQILFQGPGFADTPESSDAFGTSLASGDFNGDGKYDLAIGVPFESRNGEATAYAGIVHLIYGSPTGLSAASPLEDQLWEQGLNGLDDTSEAADYFGLSLSSGDFNGDDKDDLVIGVPFESVNGGTTPNAGKVHVIYGSPSGLSTTSPLADQLWEQGLNGLDDASEAFDSFGSSLATGDFNGDGKYDLVIGVPDEAVNGGTTPNAGKVHVIYGSSSGLSTISPLADQLWEQGLNGLDDTSEPYDRFGSTL